ncbi:MAG: DUF2851 family protein [Crocinitomicaceae bacterium]|nr:DUF2851 family protein [Crocinitomicaceae bacterium]
MTETFLHYLFDSRKLGRSFTTTEGEKIEVLNFGKLNKSSGPDFLEATLRYDKKIWAGHVEFHLKSSDWIKHGHHNDVAYKNVIAHFVYDHDKEIIIDKFKLPVVELKEKVSKEAFENYRQVLNHQKIIPCEAFIPEIEQDIIHRQLNEVLRQRLDRKSEEYLAILKKYRGDQRKLYLFLMAKAMGGSNNKDAFITLIEKIDTTILAHLNFNPFKVEALFLGLSGLLETARLDHPYLTALCTEFDYQRKLYQLHPLSKASWKFYGMRPAGHPVFRIVQLAALSCKLNELDVQEDWSDLYLEMHPFWETHYNLSSETKKHNPQLSKGLQTNLIINVLVPYRYALASFRNSENEKEDVFRYLKQLPSERNSIVKMWQNFGVSVNHAGDSQALIELKNNHCNEKKCLFCTIGRTVLKQ